MNGRLFIHKTRAVGMTCSIVAMACVLAAHADTPQADKLPSSTNPQVRAVVDRMGNRIGELETRQAKQDEILDVQKDALVVVNKAIDSQHSFAEKVAAENETLKADLKETKAERDAARKGKWKLAGMVGGFLLLVGLVVGFVARGSPGGGVVVGIPVTGDSDSGGPAPEPERQPGVSAALAAGEKLEKEYDAALSVAEKSTTRPAKAKAAARKR